MSQPSTLGCLVVSNLYFTLYLQKNIWGYIYLMNYDMVSQWAQMEGFRQRVLFYLAEYLYILWTDVSKHCVRDFKNSVGSKMINE